MALKEISLDKLDELFAICTDLNVLIYIKALIYEDINFHVVSKRAGRSEEKCRLFYFES